MNMIEKSGIRKVLSGRMVRLIGLSILINVAIGLTRWLLDTEQSTLIGLFTGVISVAIADLILCSKEQRSQRLEQAKAFVREHGATATKCTIWLCFIVGAHLSRKLPTDPLVQQIAHWVEIFGLLLVIAYPAMRSVVSSWSLSFILSSVFQGIAAYSIALWAIGEFGDDMLAFARANPSEAIAVIVALVIIREIVRFSGGRSPEPEYITRQAAAVAARRQSPTVRDHRYTAAHEAGHAMVYAALAKLPADLRLVVHGEADGAGVLGFVTGINSDHHLQEKTFAEWYMLVFLAGKLGEAAMFGESTLGSTSDHQRWLNLARPYLSNHYRGVFYAEPATKLEQEQNEQKLEALQHEQLTLLQALFDQNQAVFKEFADTLLDKRTMTAHDIAPFLDRVSLPDNFPRPKEIQLESNQGE